MRSTFLRPGGSIALASATLLLAALFAPAPTTADQLTVNANQDARVSSNNADTNYGDGYTLQHGVAAVGGDKERSYVNFHVDFPYKAIVTAATLKLNCTATSNGTAEVRRIVGAWAEGTVTWNAQPAVASTDSVEVGVNGTGIVEFDVRAMARQLNCSYGGNLGFRLVENDESGTGTLVTYDSRERPGGTAAQLVLTYRPPVHVAAVATGQANPVYVHEPVGGPVPFAVRFEVLVPQAECTKFIRPSCGIADPGSPIRFQCPTQELEVQPGQTAVITIPGEVQPGATTGQTNAIVLHATDEDGQTVDSAPLVVEVTGAVGVRARGWGEVKTLFQ